MSAEKDEGAIDAAEEAAEAVAALQARVEGDEAVPTEADAAYPPADLIAGDGGPPEYQRTVILDELGKAEGPVEFEELQLAVGIGEEELRAALEWLRLDAGVVVEVDPDEYALADEQRVDDAEEVAEPVEASDEELREEVAKLGPTAADFDAPDVVGGRRPAAAGTVGEATGVVRVMAVLDFTFTPTGSGDDALAGEAEEMVAEAAGVTGGKWQLVKVEAYDTPRQVFP